MRKLLEFNVRELTRKYFISKLPICPGKYTDSISSTGKQYKKAVYW